MVSQPSGREDSKELAVNQRWFPGAAAAKFHGQQGCDLTVLEATLESGSLSQREVTE